MKEAVFIINHRFTADSLRNEIFDKETGQKTRLEPRLMKLLCILTERQGEVVKREFILKEIWDDYPGANEGLNQAISFLRKLLADENKAIILTQPKMGYCFNAVISWKNQHPPEKKAKYLSKIIIALALLLFLVFMLSRYFAKKDIQTNSARELYERDAREISRKDSIHQAQKMRTSKDTLGPAARGDSIH